MKHSSILPPFFLFFLPLTIRRRFSFTTDFLFKQTPPPPHRNSFCFFFKY